MYNLFQTLILASARDWTVESQVCKPWRLLIEAGCFQMRVETSFPSVHLVHPSLLQKSPFASEASGISTLLHSWNQLVLRLTLQFQTIDAVTYQPSHTTDYSVPQFTALFVRVEEEKKESKWRVDCQMSGTPYWDDLSMNQVSAIFRYKSLHENNFTAYSAINILYIFKLFYLDNVNEHVWQSGWEIKMYFPSTTMQRSIV